jgi:cyclohexyl-isocyanide hydratase
VKHTVVIPLFAGITQLDFTAPHQVLSRAGGIEVVVASLDGSDIAVEGGLTFSNLAKLTEIEHCDVLLVPGGAGVIDVMLDPTFMNEISRLGSTARYLTSVCTGSLILGASGFLTGKRAACHWAWRDLLLPFGAVVDDGRVVRDGNVITGGGVTAGLDFALTLLAELQGERVARTLTLGLEYAPEPPFGHGRPEFAATELLAEYKHKYLSDWASKQSKVLEAASRLQAHLADEVAQ